MLRCSNDSIAYILIFSQSKSKVKGIPESAVETSTGFYDGGYVLDPVKKLPNDIGRFLHVVADIAIMSNSYASNYVQNLANLVGGFYSAIDPKSAIWNKPLNVHPDPGPGLHPDPAERPHLRQVQRAALEGRQQRTDTICQRADLYEGQSSLDGLQMTSMKSAMDEDMMKLQKRGYLSKAIINISTTQAQQNQGRPSVLRQLLPRLSVLPRSKRLARGREPRPEPASDIETRSDYSGDRPGISCSKADTAFRPGFRHRRPCGR